jgi:hypothetical protein
MKVYDESNFSIYEKGEPNITTMKDDEIIKEENNDLQGNIDTSFLKIKNDSKLICFRRNSIRTI